MVLPVSNETACAVGVLRRVRRPGVLLLWCSLRRPPMAPAALDLRKRGCVPQRSRLTFQPTGSARLPSSPNAVGVSGVASWQRWSDPNPLVSLYAKPASVLDLVWFSALGCPCMGHSCELWSLTGSVEKQRTVERLMKGFEFRLGAQCAKRSPSHMPLLVFLTASARRPLAFPWKRELADPLRATQCRIAGNLCSSESGDESVARSHALGKWPSCSTIPRVTDAARVG